ncbi:MAG: hypothetical protein KDA84_07975 [Planctomycetaceae bacterium]|nr:hypothetical protein [Planctomycetaceae bacterium]
MIPYDFRDKAPSDQSIRNALYATLPGVQELEQQLHQALATDCPQALRRKPRMIAIDWTLIPYHGQPAMECRTKTVSRTASFSRFIAVD